MAGRPPIYENLEQMLPVLQTWEAGINAGEKPTITGLTLALGFCDKSTLYDYAKKPEFTHPIKRAMLIVEHGYEKALRENNATGPIFALKNFGWVDKQNIDHTTKDQAIMNIDASKLTDEQLRRLAEIQREAGISEA
jgi:hypothetical protein